MIQDSQPDFGAILNTVTDAVQHALDDYTATAQNTIAHPDLRKLSPPPPSRPTPGLNI